MMQDDNAIVELHIAIVGGGLGGWALARAFQCAFGEDGCLMLGIRVKWTLLERDSGLEARPQGYALTLQQGGGALRALQLVDRTLPHCTASTAHYVFDASGRPLLFWGPLRRSQFATTSPTLQRTKWTGTHNVHIPRQSLRRVLYDSTKDSSALTIRWSAHVERVEQQKLKKSLSVQFRDGTSIDADLVVGCDGIWTSVGRHLHSAYPLEYLGVIVILGISKCPLSHRERVWQTSDGSNRLFVMPFDALRCMWQLSFPYPHIGARRVANDSKRLYSLAWERCGSWHFPIPQMLEQTPLNEISGYPVYDRPPLSPNMMRLTLEHPRITMLGDAAHCMSPFKGQGANQALLDAQQLTERLTFALKRLSKRDSIHVLSAIDDAVIVYERIMLERTAGKVFGSRKSVPLLHSRAGTNPEYQLKRRGWMGDARNDIVQRLERMHRDQIDANSPAQLLDHYAFE